MIKKQKIKKLKTNLWDVAPCLKCILKIPRSIPMQKQTCHVRDSNWVPFGGQPKILEFIRKGSLPNKKRAKLWTLSKQGVRTHLFDGGLSSDWLSEPA